MQSRKEGQLCAIHAHLVRPALSFLQCQLICSSIKWTHCRGVSYTMSQGRTCSTCLCHWELGSSEVEVASVPFHYFWEGIQLPDPVLQSTLLQAAPSVGVPSPGYSTAFKWCKATFWNLPSLINEIYLFKSRICSFWVCLFSFLKECHWYV